jgi:hypothetical protein
MWNITKGARSFTLNARHLLSKKTKIITIDLLTKQWIAAGDWLIVHSDIHLYAYNLSGNTDKPVRMHADVGSFITDVSITANGDVRIETKNNKGRHVNIYSIV